MSRIAAVFDRLRQQGRKALIPFITAGDPDPQSTVPLMHGLVAAGADMVELGVPFSDPMADGPTIQRASERALQWGISLRTVLALAHQFRKDDPHTPLVLMGYANPIEAFGIDAFCSAAQASGVDGVLVVDYPPEEAREFAGKLRAAGLDPIFLLAPTSVESRYRAVAELGSGYIYYVSLKGVTGAAHLDVADVAARIPTIRAQVGIPVGVGFGIRDAETAKRISAIADAVVIGSRIVEEIERSPRDQVVARVSAFLRGIRVAIDEVETTAGGVP